MHVSIYIVYIGYTKRIRGVVDETNHPPKNFSATYHEWTGSKLESLCYGMFSNRLDYDIWVAQKPPILIDRTR